MRLYLFIIVALVLISWGYLQVYQHLQAPQYVAKDGTLDLRGHNWRKAPIVRLDGEWNFRRKLANNDWDTTVVKAKVPGLWNDLRLDSNFSRGIGVGEYSLTVLKDRVPVPMAIMVNDFLPSTYQLYGGTDKRAFIKVGTIASDSSQSTASYGPRWLMLPRQFSIPDTLQLRMVVANHHHRKGGMSKSIEFGIDGPIRMTFNRRAAVELIIAGIFFFFSLFNICLYAFFAREKIFLYLGLFCLGAFIRIISANQSVMHFVWPNAPWSIVQRMRYVSVSFNYLLILGCFREVMPEYIRSKPFRWLGYLGVVIVLLFLLASNYRASQLNVLLLGYAFIVVIYIIHRGIEYWQDGQIAASALFVGGLLYIIFGVHDFLVGSNIIYGQYFSAYGLLILAIMQSNLVIRRFAEIYQANGVLVESLQASNQKLVEATNLLESKVQERTEKLVEQNQQLRALQAYKHQMTSTLVHDLKNPLQIIIGRNQRVDGDRITLQASQRMLLFIQNLLDIDRAKSRGLKLRLELLRLVDVLNESVERLSPFALQKQVIIRIAIDEQLFVQSDRLLTERIFDNVIHNAIKYSPVRGLVTITGAVASENILVKIIDQGPGISEEERGRVFTAYKAEKSSAGAHGLGLSFVKTALEEIGGSIMFAPNEGAPGSCFTLSFPQSRPMKASTSLPVLNRAESTVFAIVAKRLLATTIYDTSTIKLYLDELPDEGGFSGLKEALLNWSFAGNQEDFVACIQENMIEDEL